MLFANIAVLFGFHPRAASTRLLPITKRHTNDDPSTSTSYIVALKPDTVDPLNRGAWPDNIFAAANASLSDDEKSTLQLGCRETTFNGIAGMFNTDALNVLRAHQNVEYIQESACLSDPYLPFPTFPLPVLTLVLYPFRRHHEEDPPR